MQLSPDAAVTALGCAFLTGLAGFHTVVYLVQMLSLRFAPASIVAPLFNLESVMTTGGAALPPGECLAVNQYAGSGMLLTALFASSLIKDRAENP